MGRVSPIGRGVFVLCVAGACALHAVASAREAVPAQTQAPRDAPPTSGTAAIRGRVFAAGNRPLAKVDVRAFGPGGEKAALTDGNGGYEIRDLAAGKYTLSASRQNYVRASYGERRPLGPGTPIEVAAGQIVAGADFVLQHTAAITGRIVDELGEPAIGVQVAATRFNGANGERRTQMAGAMATTNDLGEYRLHGLSPGRYYVTAVPRADGDVNERTSYMPTLYPGTANPVEAQRLTLTAGQTIAGVSFGIVPTTGSRVSGVALDGAGRPMAGGSVAVTSRGALGSTAFAMLRPDGTFTVGPLPPGDYRLRASVGFQPDEFAVATVTVSGSDVNDVQLVAAKPSLVRGRIVFDDSAAARPAAAAVHLNLAPLPSESYASGASATGNKDDTFELKAAAGRMLLRAGTSAPGGWHVDRVLLGDVDVTDDGFDIPQNGALEGLVVVLTTQHNTISGRVLDASGAFVRDCTIVVFAQDSRRWTYGSRYVSTARPDPQSVFHLRLPAGDYFAAAFAVDDQTPPLEREVLQQLVPYAIRFTIGPTETKTLEIAIGPAPEY